MTGRNANQSRSVRHLTDWLSDCRAWCGMPHSSWHTAYAAFPMKQQLKNSAESFGHRFQPPPSPISVGHFTPTNVGYTIFQTQILWQWLIESVVQLGLY